MSSDVRRRRSRTALPRNYLTILEAVCAVDPNHHVTAADVYARARLAQPKIGFATVHRGLTRLHELGHVLKLDVPGATSAVYEPAASPHAHFRCSDCGRIRDVDFRVPVEQLADLSTRLGFEIRAESTIFVGRCAECMSAQPES